MTDPNTKPDAIRLLLFNPETDYALACGNRNYSPPAAVKRFRDSMALFPALYALMGDIIVLPSRPVADPLASHREIARRKELRVLDLKDLPVFFKSESDFTIFPWGWNHTLRRELSALGCPENKIKTEDSINRLRELAHRRLTIKAREMLADTAWVNPETEEVFCWPQAEGFLNRNPDAFFKLPWSSSGRGVVRSRHLQPQRLREWIEGGIKNQGSVMAESALDITSDFASEWTVDKGKVHFEGLSFFSTLSGFRYGRNLFAPQDRIMDRIKSAASQWSDVILERQAEVIETLIAPGYEGPLGIDMAATSDGRICPLIEVNLRMTMGLAAILTCESDKYFK